MDRTNRLTLKDHAILNAAPVLIVLRVLACVLVVRGVVLWLNVPEPPSLGLLLGLVVCGSAGARGFACHVWESFTPVRGRFTLWETECVDALALWIGVTLGLQLFIVDAWTTSLAVASLGTLLCAPAFAGHWLGRRWLFGIGQADKTTLASLVGPPPHPDQYLAFRQNLTSFVLTGTTVTAGFVGVTALFMRIIGPGIVSRMTLGGVPLLLALSIVSVPMIVAIGANRAGSDASVGRAYLFGAGQFLVIVAIVSGVSALVLIDVAMFPFFVIGFVTVATACAAPTALGAWVLTKTAYQPPVSDVFA